MPKLLRRIVAVFCYSFAAIIILAALAVSIASVITPVLNGHKPEFEKFASQLLTQTVQITQIHISWDEYEPELSFDDVIIIDPKTSKPIFEIPHIIINISIWRSLFEWKPLLESIRVSGVHLTMSQTAGPSHINGVNSISVTDSFTGNSVDTTKVLDWIFSQPYLILQNIDLKLIPSNGIEHSVTLGWLMLKNSSKIHTLSGDAVLNQEVPTNIKINFHWLGSVTDIPHITAELYLYFEGVSLPQWFSNHIWQHLQIQQGLGSAKIWAYWHDNAWQQLQSTLEFYDVQAISLITKKQLVISRLSGNLGWQRKGDSQIIAGDDLLMDLPNHLWPTDRFTLQYGKNADGSFALQNLHLGYVDLSDVQDLIQASGLLPNNFQKWLDTFNPQGEIKNVSAVFKGPIDDPANLNVSLDFTGLAMNAWQSIPSLANLTGSLAWDGKQGQLALDSQQVLMTMNNVFAYPLQFDKVSATVHWQQDANHAWELLATNVKAQNADLIAVGDVGLTLPPNDSPTINLKGFFEVMKVAHISRYMPAKIFEPALNEWLAQGFLGGAVKQGTAILQGRLADFPFDKGNGKFLVKGMPSNIDFNYAPDWPTMHGVNGLLVYSGRSMTIDINSGNILGIPIYKAHAVIPYFGDAEPQVLHVQGELKGDLTQGMQFIQHSPLANTLGKDLAELQLKGPMQLTIGLIVPLRYPDNIEVDGKAILQDATLELPDWDLAVNKVAGGFQFTGNSISATNMQGELFSKPISLTLSTNKSNKNVSYVVANIKGDVSISDIQSWLHLPLDQVLQGTTSYQAELHLPPHDQVTQPTQVLVSSTLQGITVNLPDGYAKKPGVGTNFQFNVDVLTNQPLKAKIVYGNLLTAAMTLKRVDKKLQLVSGNLNLGTGTANWQTQPGILVSGNLPQLDWDKIQPYVAQFTANNAENKNSFDPTMFRAVDMNIGVVKVAGLQLDNLHIQLTKNANYFVIGLTNTDMSGQIEMPIKSQQTIQANFTRLRLKAQPNQQSNINPKSLPAIQFQGDDVWYGDMRLGEVKLSLVPTKDGVAFKELNLSSNAYVLSATGTWEGTAKNSTSDIQGELNSNNITEMLKQWGFASSSLVGSKGNVSFDLAWPGAPYNPNMSGMDGKLSLSLGEGRIINLSDSTDAKMGLGRMLSIFSLQSIPRRLSFDFSDLFEQGYSFDTLKGNFIITKGNAVTNNTKIDGPVAHVGIYGRIGLGTKDYNVKLRVTPHVTSSLPVVTALAINPIAGVATWVVDKVVSKSVSSITTYEYIVTGPWNNPVWQQLNASGAKTK